MTAKLLERFKQQITSLELIPSSGGRFEVEADGHLLFSKLQEGRFPDESDMLSAIAQRLKP